MNAQPVQGVARISISDIAKLADVSRPAVSNWRKRFPDFPQPVQGGTSTNPAFDLGEVESWLKRTDRYKGGSGGQKLLWRSLDALRGELSTDESFEAIAAFIFYRFLSEEPRRANHGAARFVVRPELSWENLRLGDPSTLVDRLQSNVQVLEQENPRLENLMTAPLQQLTSRRAIEQLFLIDESPFDQLPDLFEALIAQRRRSTGRGGSEWTTSQDLVTLLVNMAVPIKGTVYDPASGAGDFLLHAARSATGPVSVVGQEVNTSSWRLSNQRLIVHGIDGEVFRGDTLNDDAKPQLKADIVLLDPPYGSKNRALELSGPDPRWRFGPPSPNNADTAWLQHAVSHLAVGGRAYVLLPAGSLFRGGADSRIRHELIRQGVLESVVALPSGLQTWTGIPLALWVLTRPGDVAQRDQVLLIDATEGGNKEIRSAVPRIAETYHAWRDDGVLADLGHAATPAVIDLLAVDSSLIPAQWISVPQDADQRARMLSGLENATDQLTRQVSVLRKLSSPSFEEITASAGEAQRGSVGGFISDGRLTMIRGARIRPEDRTDSDAGTPVIGPRELRSNRVSPEECPRIDPSDFDRAPEFTEPGDVVVSTEGRTIKAAAVVRGGAAVLAPLVVLRVRSGWMDPRFLAACLESDWNTKYLVGAAIPRARVKDLEVPLVALDKQKVLADILQSTSDLQTAAENIATSADEVMHQMINGIVAGALDVSS